MICSESNLLFSIRKVTYSSGGKTPGMDGITYTTPAERFSLFQKLLTYNLDGHLAVPVKRIHIPKPDGRVRPLGIPTVFDRVLQMVIKNALEPEWESQFESGSYGFRPRRSVNDAINRIYLALNKPGSRTWVLDADVSVCFDTISHEYLLQELKHFPYLDIINKWLKSGITFSNVWFESDQGTPQGGVLSPLLCNIALHGMEKELGVRTYNAKGHVDSNGPLMIRYADDFVVFYRSKQEAENGLDVVKDSLKKRGLTISEAKTRIVHAAQGFNFLGFNICYRPKDGKYLGTCIIPIGNGDFFVKYEDVGTYIQPGEKSITNFKNKMREIFKSHHGKNCKALCLKANAVIRGWANSKRAWHSNRTFRNLDHFLFDLQWAWACRQHPNKNKTWVRENYFTHLIAGPINNKWVFHAKGKSKIYMYQLKWFPIQRHILVQSAACADDPNFTDYWVKLDNIRMNKKLFNYWNHSDDDLSKSQFEICPICLESLFNGEEIHRHHIIEQRKGGPSNFSNLLFLHLPCHYQVHHSRGEKQEELQNILVAFKKSHPNR
uniref:RT-Mat-En n=1 Tax=Chlamydomonas subcaudata TaxID=163303 RepID=U5I1W8_CHLSU|nr:RT-Mat-En [Chlamydomonas subcaudata]